MNAVYGQWGARLYNRVWQNFEIETLAAALALVDLAALRATVEREARRPRVLDAGCGTGILLCHLQRRMPEADLYGVDASEAMLAQARESLGASPHVHLARARLGAGETAHLPFAPGTFDLITCTNTLHYLADPAPALAGLRRLLRPQGQLVLEDYARRPPPFPWCVFEAVVRALDPAHARAYTLAEARECAQRAGLAVAATRAFAAGWLWRGWALRAVPAAARDDAGLP